jgi:hypothetical protein
MAEELPTNQNELGVTTVASVETTRDRSEDGI